MKRLFWLLLFAAAAWFGWNHRDSLTGGQRRSEIVVTNDTDAAALRMRIALGATRVAKERVEPHESVTLPFPYSGGTGSFHVEWQFENVPAEYSWDGGTFVPGPIPTRHTFHLIGGQEVTWAQEPLALSSGNR